MKRAVFFIPRRNNLLTHLDKKKKKKGSSGCFSQTNKNKIRTKVTLGRQDCLTFFAYKKKNNKKQNCSWLISTMPRLCSLFYLEPLARRRYCAWQSWRAARKRVCWWSTWQKVWSSESLPRQRHELRVQTDRLCMHRHTSQTKQTPELSCKLMFGCCNLLLKQIQDQMCFISVVLLRRHRGKQRNGKQTRCRDRDFLLEYLFNDGYLWAWCR